MILQALTQYYETLLSLGKIAAPGWGLAKVSFGLELGTDGNLLQVFSYKSEEQRGKKTVMAPRVMAVPMPVKRSSDVSANFLCDNSGYLLGADAKGKPERTLDCFAACAALHKEILDGVDAPAAQAVLAFFETWQPAQAAEHPALKEYWEELIGGANLVFCHGMHPVCDDPAVRAAWQAHYDGGGADSQVITCLVTGKQDQVALVHPAIKGVRDAQSSGAALVSFNGPAFESYDREQGMNAPIGKYAAFAYTTALNTLLADGAHCRVIGDTTMVCWAEHGGSGYQNACMAALFGWPDKQGISDQVMSAMLASLAKGDPFDWDGVTLLPEEHFYILGLAPNAARVSVRFFLRDSFGDFARNIKRHYQDTAVPHSSRDVFDTLPVWKLLSETVNQNSRDKAPSPQLTGELLRAILTGGPYPATLLTGADLRIRAEHEVTRGRAAIIKGYYTRFNAGKGHPHCPKEVLEMPDKTTNIPYTLGQLFSIYEQIQLAANPGINTTIKDKYFNSASSTPARVFPVLCNLAQKHLRKLDTGLHIYFDRQLGELSAAVGDHYPARMDLAEQGAFQLGYYAKNLKRFEKKATTKEENNNV